MTTGSRSSSATASRPMWNDSRLPAVVGRLVDAAEDQGGLAEVELGEAGHDRLLEHVPLVAGLEGAPEPASVSVRSFQASCRVRSRHS